MNGEAFALFNFLFLTYYDQRNFLGVSSNEGDKPGLTLVSAGTFIVKGYAGDTRGLDRTPL